MSSEKVSLSDMTLQLFRNCGLTVEQRMAKRIFDICFSALVMALLSWLYLLIAFYIKVVRRDSVLIKRECLTKDGKHFWQYKFNGRHLLIATHLDELPQFFNILRGICLW